jgi:hypothetical protein
MTPDDLLRVIRTLDVMPLAAAPERGFRPSLAGLQRKALLGLADDGTWQLPSGDAPSTWILKPDGPHAMAAELCRPWDRIPRAVPAAGPPYRHSFWAERAVVTLPVTLIRSAARPARRHR